MKRMLQLSLLSVQVVMFAGCATGIRSVSSEAFGAVPGEHRSGTVETDRMLIWRAWLTLEVGCVSHAASRVSEIAEQNGGYVQDKTVTGEERSHISLRVAVASLDGAMASLASLGNVVSRRVSSQDVTEQYVDTDARLRTMVALRDRLRALLDQARDVTDILAIEKELSRVQSDIDAMQARFKALKGKVDLASINVSIRRKRILGPLGYLMNGAWWTVEKLFVIQE